MKFELRHGLGIYVDHRPANAVEMVGPNRSKMVFRPDASSFSDASHHYEWAFEWSGPITNGQVFAFASTDRVVRGVVREGAIIVPDLDRTVPRFEQRLGAIVFHDDKPGNAVTLHGPGGQSLRTNLSASSASDSARAYAWGFSYDGELRDGQRFVFATADRTVHGEVVSGAIQIVAAPPPSAAPRLVSIKSQRAQRTTTSVRCLMINPSVPYNQWSCYRPGVMNEASFSAHGMAYVSATLKNAGHTCWLVDLRSLSSWAHVESVLREQEYDIAFVGFLSIDAFNAACVVRLLKEIHPNRPVVVGGLHVSIAKERVFPRPDLISYYCWDNYEIVPDVFKQFLGWKGEDRFDSNRFPLADYVILDDGEIAARALVADLAAGRRPAERTIEGGAVPMEVARHMDRDLFDLDVEAHSPILPFQPVPMVTVTWARGCPFHCRYCNLASQLSNTNVREKPVELVEEELDDLHRRFGGRLGSLMIHDDLTFDPKHIAKWCELILRKYGPIPIWMQTRADWVVTRYRRQRDFWELLCRAGLTWVSIGYESGSQRVLDYMRKDNTVENNVECGRILDEYGVNSFGNFLWGVPTESRQEAEETVELVKQIKPGFLSGSIYCNYPGTQLDAECREKGLLVPGEVYTRSHLPWQITVRGIDYPHRIDCVRRAGEYANYLRMPKLLSEDRKRDLAASSRGLEIHR